MGRLGIGVMLKFLGGSRESLGVLKKGIGKRIVGLELVDRWQHDGDGENNELVFTFEDGYKMGVFDDGQSCCESRWMHTDDKLEDFIDSTLINIEVREGSNWEDDGDYTESQFLIVTTSLGAFTMVNYNEHNGYYGGFWMECEEL